MQLGLLLLKCVTVGGEVLKAQSEAAITPYLVWGLARLEVANAVARVGVAPLQTTANSKAMDGNWGHSMPVTKR